MDTTKARLFAAIAGIILGLGGVYALAIATTLALASVLGLIGAVFTVAAVLLSGACLCLYLFLEPNKPAAEELDELEDATADALAELPFDTLRAIVDKRPLTMTLVALVAGYTLVRDPAAAARQVQRFLTELI